MPLNFSPLQSKLTRTSFDDCLSSNSTFALSCLNVSLIESLLIAAADLSCSQPRRAISLR